MALSEREHRISALSGMETKLGVLLGLSAVLVVLAVEWDTLCTRLLSAVPALLAALVCLFGLFTRRVEALNLQALRQGKVTSSADQAALAALDTIIEYDDGLRRALRDLRICVNAAGGLLVAATLINFILVMLDPTTSP